MSLSAGQFLAVRCVNMPQFLQAIVEAPNVQLKMMRSAMNAGLKGIRKNFIKAQLQGPPGIQGGPLAKGKNVFTFVDGRSLRQLGGKIGISRILHVHEIGMTIVSKRGGMLFLHEKGRGPIFAVAKQVMIPARLKFVQQVEAEGPGVLRAVAGAGMDATSVTLKKALL